MTEAHFQKILEHARKNPPNLKKIDAKLHRLIAAEESTRVHPLSFLYLKPVASLALFLFAITGILGLVYTVNETQYAIARYERDQADMREARENVFSNAEHVYSVLFER